MKRMQRGIRRNRVNSNRHHDEELSSITTNEKDRRRKKLLSSAWLTIVVVLVAVILFGYSSTRASKRDRKSSVHRDTVAKASLASPISSTNTTLVECRISTPNWTEKGAANGVWRITVYNQEPFAQIFLSLVVDGYYDGTYLFRVIRGFVAQWGFHSATEVGKWRITQKRKEDQMAKNYEGSLSNVRGTLTMIKGDLPQVFLNLGSNRRLDKEATVPFGAVDDDSMDVANKLYIGYKPGQGQIPAIKNRTVSTLFPKMSMVEKCHIVQSHVTTSK